MYNSLTPFKTNKMSRPNSLTQKLSQKDKDFLFHPNTNLVAHQDSGPFILERGEGIYVYDTDGNKYIEGISCPKCYDNLTDKQKKRFAMRQYNIKNSH